MSDRRKLATVRDRRRAPRSPERSSTLICGRHDGAVDRTRMRVRVACFRWGEIRDLFSACVCRVRGGVAEMKVSGVCQRGAAAEAHRTKHTHTQRDTQRTKRTHAKHTQQTGTQRGEQWDERPPPAPPTEARDACGPEDVTDGCGTRTAAQRSAQHKTQEHAHNTARCTLDCTRSAEQACSALGRGLRTDGVVLPLFLASRPPPVE